MHARLFKVLLANPDGLLRRQFERAKLSADIQEEHRPPVHLRANNVGSDEDVKKDDAAGLCGTYIASHLSVAA